MRKGFYIFFALVLIATLGVTFWLFFGKSTQNVSGSPSNQNPFGFVADKVSQFVTGNTYGEATSTISERIEGFDPVIFKVWDKPTAGFLFVDYEYLVGATSTTASGTLITKQERATSTIMMFIDRTTGYVYGYDTLKRATHQITNTLIPGVYDAYLYAGGKQALIRYQNERGDIQSEIITIPRVAPGRDPVSIDQTVSLPSDVTSVAVSGDGKTISYLVPTVTNSSIYSLTDAGKVSRIDQSLSEWTLHYAGNTLLTSTKASAYILGYVFDVAKGVRTLGNRTGLTISPSPKNTTYFASMWSQAGLASFFFNTQTGTVVLSNIKTPAEKCAWNPSADYIVCGTPKELPIATEGLPDDWYQGRTSFDDILSVAFQDTGRGSQILDIQEEAGENVDVERISFKQDSSALGFINKKDGSLWFVNIEPLLEGISN